MFGSIQRFGRKMVGYLKKAFGAVRGFAASARDRMSGLFRSAQDHTVTKRATTAVSGTGATIAGWLRATRIATPFTAVKNWMTSTPALSWLGGVFGAVTGAAVMVVMAIPSGYDALVRLVKWAVAETTIILYMVSMFVAAIPAWLIMGIGKLVGHVNTDAGASVQVFAHRALSWMFTGLFKAAVFAGHALKHAAAAFAHPFTRRSANTASIAALVLLAGAKVISVTTTSLAVFTGAVMYAWIAAAAVSVLALTAGVAVGLLVLQGITALRAPKVEPDEAAKAKENEENRALITETVNHYLHPSFADLNGAHRAKATTGRISQMMADKVAQLEGFTDADKADIRAVLDEAYAVYEANEAAKAEPVTAQPTANPNKRNSSAGQSNSRNAARRATNKARSATVRAKSPVPVG